MSKTNIFQGSNGINEVVYDVLKYEKTENLSSTITADIYFETYFYLCNRFGNPKIYDDYKKIMVWNFNVKQYDITIEMNSSWVTFMVFGKSSKKNRLSKNNFSSYSMRSSFWVRYWREQKRNKSKLLNIFSDKKTKRELNIINKLWEKFFELHGLASDEWTEERFEKEKQSEWLKELEKYNNAIINADSFSHLSSSSYSNSKTKHALKTLRQFINNMLTPIYVRDCPFNIKGRLSDEEASSCLRFENNIKIEFEKPKNLKTKIK